ncbi:TetR/AcrR family transcriptional regulator C-terminal domain-containing protein [Frankia sp. AgB1.9]|uniref:TetR/AcrR family transcriptional regulator n=1 Tax=unclassified Frankia TaxID=2632575 RepID=UPI001932D310|nr:MULTISPECIES: TetR/AcrR family transcriptional regulator [unclassified Frankia]MBL7494024.1 TetR/AcrR family transcriptional regulator C-terminal domain-containing protein [Frankia sp. AgW1.1]MBL7549242.1 TetR/AcrR family transcriptional regulator C-terminal domain-containing protein [Frankia sp. AgB1.9]MBL7619459.1 TetR/AcrR family transcriptional regulator C-terminal domain-containing protein [Frankia sp. AgB1.8]
MPGTPRSRRERPAKPALTRDGIVDAAMKVLERDGFEKLTLRRLAADLDTGPASLYVYVAGNTELYSLLLGRLLADLDVSWDGRDDWRVRLRTVLIDYVDLLMSQPGLARSAVTTWPRGPHYLDLVELVIRLLVAGGVPEPRAAWGVDILLQQATAMAAEFGTRAEPDQGQQLDDLTAEFAGADSRRHPILSRLGAAALVGGDHEARRTWAIDTLIEGLTATPRPGE